VPRGRKEMEADNKMVRTMRLATKKGSPWLTGFSMECFHCKALERNVISNSSTAYYLENCQSTNRDSPNAPSIK
jgi:hypothetical protein